MPLVRIDLPAGRPASHRAALGEAVQQALHAVLGVLLEERFQVIAEHAPGGLLVDPVYLGVDRSGDAEVMQVFLDRGRDTARKAAYFATLAHEVQARARLLREKPVVSLVEVGREDWSSGNGEMQLAS